MTNTYGTPKKYMNGGLKGEIYRRMKNLKNEKDIWEKLCNEIPDETLKARIQSAGEWYANSAYLYKWIFYICRLLLALHCQLQ